VSGLQSALAAIGSVQNVTLTHLARTRKILFVEGDNDFKIIRRFAKKMNLDNIAYGNDLTPFKTTAFSRWESIESFAWAFRSIFDENIKIGVILDGDYRGNLENEKILHRLNEAVNFSWIHQCKEIENFLINFEVLARVIQKYGKLNSSPISELISLAEQITDSMRHDIEGLIMHVALREIKASKIGIDESTATRQFLKSFDSDWKKLEYRIRIASGKEVLSNIRTAVSIKWKVTLTEARIIDEFTEGEIAEGMKEMLKTLEDYRVS